MDSLVLSMDFQKKKKKKKKKRKKERHKEEKDGLNWVTVKKT